MTSNYSVLFKKTNGIAKLIFPPLNSEKGTNIMLKLANEFGDSVALREADDIRSVAGANILFIRPIIP